MAPPTINLRRAAIPTPQQRQSSLPIPTCAQPVKVRRLPDAQSVADLVHRRALVHVCAVAAEAQVAVVVCLGGGDAGRVGDAHSFGERGVLRVACGGALHGEGDARVGVGLVSGGVGGFSQCP